MIKSLRLRLQLFHAIILTFVVILFGATFNRQIHRSMMGEIDDGLLSGARVLEGTLRRLPPMPSDEEVQRLPLDLPPNIDRRRPPGPAGQNRADFPPSDIQPPRFKPLRSTPYFAIFSSEGNLLRSETDKIQVAWTSTQRPVEYRDVGQRREVLLRGPHRMLIIVGRDIDLELNRLSTLLVQLVLVGAGVLGLGLIGGWWLAGNAIRPIQQISQTAEGISARNLAERIDTSSMDYELQSLGTTLNSMLSRIESAFAKQCQFTADASHDLRTPLAVILSHCELALSRPRSSEEYQSSLGTCLAAAARMKSLVDGLLLLARADAGELELQRTQIDLSDLAAEAIELFSPYAAEHQVELKLVAAAAPCVADRAAISQVIANLLDNAILYNREGGFVTLSTTCAAGMASLEIQDTGVGIPADALPRVFDRFYRVDEARTRQGENAGQSGSGLGLSICKDIVDAHGGNLSVTSELTVGSSFVVELPSSLDSQ